jgi:predicted metal-dependent phosphoesterase TrpH
MKKADLHLHTVASDGTDTVEQRLEQADEQGLDGIAITDHDTIGTELEELDRRSMVADNGVELITGAEINCEVDDTNVEILGYFLDPNNEELHRMFDRLEDFRQARMEEMLFRLNGDLNVEIDYSDVSKYADGPVGRPHLANALHEEGVVDSPGEAFNLYIGDDCPYYVETEKLGAREVISRIHASGGVSSLAHPGRDLTKENADEVIEQLVDLGLDAIEVPYTYQHKMDQGYNINFGVAHARELAEDYDLLMTGGSDCHGSNSDKYNIGNVVLGYDNVEELRELAEEYQSSEF